MKKTLKINKNKNKKNYKNTTKIGGRPQWFESARARFNSATSAATSAARSFKPSEQVQELKAAAAKTAADAKAAATSAVRRFESDEQVQEYKAAAAKTFADAKAKADKQIKEYKDSKADSQKEIKANITQDKVIALILRNGAVKPPDPSKEQEEVVETKYDSLMTPSPIDYQKKIQQKLIGIFDTKDTKKELPWYEKSSVTSNIQQEIGFIPSNTTQEQWTKNEVRTGFARGKALTVARNRVIGDLPLICGSIRGDDGTWRQLKRNMMVLANTKTNKLMDLLLDEDGKKKYEQLVKDVNYFNVGTAEDLVDCSKKFRESLFNLYYEIITTDEFQTYIKGVATKGPIVETEVPEENKITLQNLADYLKTLNKIRIETDYDYIKAKTIYQIRTRNYKGTIIAVLKDIFGDDYTPFLTVTDETEKKEAYKNVILNLFKYNESLLGILMKNGQNVSEIRNDLYSAFQGLTTNGEIDIEKLTNETNKKHIFYLIFINKLLIEVLTEHGNIRHSEKALSHDDATGEEGSVGPTAREEEGSVGPTAREEEGSGGPTAREEEGSGGPGDGAGEEGSAGGGIVKRGTRKRRKRNKNKSRKNIKSK